MKLLAASFGRRAALPVALVLVAAAASADILDKWPIRPKGTTLRARPELGGTVIATASTPYSLKSQTGATYKGTVQQSVIQRKKTGTLDFSIRILSDPASTGNLRYFSITGFQDFHPLDVDYRNDGLGTQGTDSVNFNTVGNPSYEEVTFFFDKILIGPGQETKAHFLGTTATKYTKAGKIVLQVQGDSVDIPSFKPVK